MKRITIIGANSFIGRNLMRFISDSGADVTAYLYDREPLHKDGADNYFQVNILDVESASGIRFDVDAVYLFAGMTGTMAGFDNPSDYVNVNEVGLLNILNAMRLSHSQAKLVFPSTRLVYAGAKGTLCEDAKKEFKTVYAVNKFACEQYLSMYHNMFGTNYCIFRICVPYGTMVEGAGSYGTVSMFLNAAKAGSDLTLYGGGEVRRTFTYMKDLCNVLLHGGLSDECLNDVFNIGGQDISLYEMAERVAKRYGVGIKSVPWPESALRLETGDTVFDSSRLDKALGLGYNSVDYFDWIDSL